VFFEENTLAKHDESPWTLVGFLKESDKRTSYLNANPELASYFARTSEMVYDVEKRLNPDWDHILQPDSSTLERFPEKYRRDPALLRTLLDGALKGLERRIRRNYKTAIPQFHRSRLQWLLPLCLETPAKADVALVVHPRGTMYVGETVLTLDQAYNNARLVARPDTEWLNP